MAKKIKKSKSGAPKVVKPSVLKRPAATTGASENDSSSVPDSGYDDVIDCMTPQMQRVIRAKRRHLEIEIARSRAGGGELPNWFLHQFDAANALPKGRQAAIRKIALAAVEQRPGKNKYKINIKKPLFEEWRAKHSSDYGVHRQKGESASGEITETTDPTTGKNNHIQAMYEVEHREDSEHNINIGAKVRITQAMADETQEALKHIGFCFIAKSVSDKKELYEERKIPEIWLHFIEKAVDAAESSVLNAIKTRQLFDASVLQLPCQNRDYADNLERLCEQVTEALTPLKKWQLLERINTDQTPDTIRNSVAAAASSTKHLTDEVERTKAICKGKKKR